ncbi:carbohydrate-selective porin OprB [Pseudomonas psychrotolerans]|nr:carbohydrate-selective porin OprB [Pseudomonas psychrotolerans]
MANQADLGLILSAPFRSRPFDSYSIKASWAQLTDHQQRFLEDAHAVSSGGGDYRPGRDEYALSLDANFVLTDSIVLSPYVTRTFHGSSYLNPVSGENPRDGYAFGVLLHVQFDQLLGLNGLK